MSTSDAQSQASSREASVAPLPKQPSLRALAPKPGTLRPPVAPSLIVPSSLPHRPYRPPSCPVCARRGCQLRTHHALVSYARQRGSSPHSQDPGRLPAASPLGRLRNSVYVKSYAYFSAQVYVDSDIAPSRIDPFFDLPVPRNTNNAQNHKLFREYFAIESVRTINLPRPPELSNDTVLSPFFLPAMQDSALCLAILAASAASQPQRSGMPAGNVAVLTLFDQAMSQLREQLSSSPDEVSDSTIAAATFLWGVNALLSDAESMQLHGKSVHALVSRKGGVANLGLAGAVGQLVMMMDCLNALMFAEQAQYHNRAVALPLNEPPAAVCGAYFIEKRSQQSIDPDLHRLCMESVGVANLLEKMISDRSTAPEYFHALSKLSYIGTGFINIYLKFKSTGTKDECTCLATQLTNVLIYYSARRQQMVVTTHAARLTRALQQQEIPTYWLRDMELLVWILFIIAMIPHDFDGKEWAMDILCQALCSRFGSEKWPDGWQETVHQMLLQFVWSDSRLHAGYTTICRSAMLRVFGDNEDG